MFRIKPFPDKESFVAYIKNYSELTGYMDRLGLFHMDLSLGRMERFWDAPKRERVAGHTGSPCRGTKRQGLELCLFRLHCPRSRVEDRAVHFAAFSDASRTGAGQSGNAVS